YRRYRIYGAIRSSGLVVATPAVTRVPRQHTHSGRSGTGRPDGERGCCVAARGLQDLSLVRPSSGIAEAAWCGAGGSVPGRAPRRDAPVARAGAEMIGGAVAPSYLFEP